MIYYWRDRLIAASFHFCISLMIAGSLAGLVFGYWYPYPYGEISGGRELFFLLMAVDVVIGPLITLIIFNKKKSKTELRRDLVLVGCFQFLALFYGLWTVAIARPVHLVFEIDRFRVVHAVDVDSSLLEKASLNLSKLPKNGPTIIAIRPFINEAERIDITLEAMQAGSVAARADLWQSYDLSRAEVLKVAQPASMLINKYPLRKQDILTAARLTGRTPEQLIYLPLIGFKTFWTILLDASNADVVGFIPLDPFE